MVAARVGPSVPRQERPAREGARVASIETGLAAAAAKLSHQVGWLTSHYNYPYLHQSEPGASPGDRAGSELVQFASLLRTGLLFHGLESHHWATSLRHCIRLIFPATLARQSPSKGCLSIQRTLWTRGWDACFLGYCAIPWTRSSMTTLALSAQQFINACVLHLC